MYEALTSILMIIQTASDVCAYNVQGYIHKLETLEEYVYPFERLKRIEKEYEKEEDKKEEDKKIEEVDEKEEEDKNDFVEEADKKNESEVV